MLRTMSDALDTLDRLRSEVETLFDAADRPGGDRTRGWTPRVDIYETPDAILVEADLPGMRREDVNIELSKDSLTISGERRLEKAAEGESRHGVERAHGPFSRSFSIGTAIDPENASASLRDGVLTLTIPKAAEARPRVVDIKAD